jgi:hypothetical protein
MQVRARQVGRRRLGGLEDSMKTEPSSCRQDAINPGLTVLSLLIVLAAVGFSMSCGGGSSTPKPTGNTTVTVVISGTANDLLSEFDLDIQSLSLTSQSGATVDLMPALESTELIHVNGGIEPLVSVSIPQGVYTSATASMNGAAFSCITLTPQGGIETSTFAYEIGASPSSTVTVNLPSPISVTGNSMALSLNLLVAQSASFSSCLVGNGLQAFAITPTFNLTAGDFTSQPTNSANGKAFEINGQVSSIDNTSDSFVLAYPELESPRTLTVSASAGAAYQGINSFTGLAVGTFVDIDGAVQADGSLMATRIAVEDLSATSFLTGPVLFVSEAEPALAIYGRQEEGALYAGIHVGGAQDFSFGNALFQISGQLANLNSLPFTPSFDAASMVAGQNIFLSAVSDTVAGGFPYTPASTLTLVPQTIDGTISSTSTAGGFTVYNVALASYDLFPTLAVQAGQTTLLNSPNEVEIYVDSNTQELNSQPLAAGGTFRFYGLVFNDLGTLRMDCAQLNDGVSVTPAAMAAVKSVVTGRASVVSSNTAGPLRQTSFRITPAK